MGDVSLTYLLVPSFPAGSSKPTVDYMIIFPLLRHIGRVSFVNTMRAYERKWRQEIGVTKRRKIP